MPAPGRPLGALVSVSLHVMAGAALLSHEPARKALLSAAPLVVELIAPAAPAARPEPVRETPPSPQLRPAVRPPPRPPEQPVAIVAPAAVPTPRVAPPPPQVPAAAPAHPAAMAAPAESIALPLPVMPPIHNAAFLNNPPPEYPPLSQRLGEQGRVFLRVLVSIAGTAEEIQILKSSGFSRLDRAATDAVRRWRFAPARQGSQAVAMWTTMDLRFDQKD